MSRNKPNFRNAKEKFQIAAGKRHTEMVRWNQDELPFQINCPSRFPPATQWASCPENHDTENFQFAAVVRDGTHFQCVFAWNPIDGGVWWGCSPWGSLGDRSTSNFISLFELELGIGQTHLFCPVGRAAVRKSSVLVRH